MILTRVVSALFVASSLVQALSVAPRAYDSFLSGFLATLNEAGLTILADNYKSIAETEEGKPIINSLKSGERTLLAPENGVRPIVPLVALSLSIFTSFALLCD